MECTTNNGCPRVGRELVSLSILLYDERIKNLTIGMSDNYSDYSWEDLNKMWWPYSRK